MRDSEEPVSPERFQIGSMEMKNAQRGYGRRDVAFQLNTMVGNGLSETHYWLDSGSIKS